MKKMLEETHRLLKTQVTWTAEMFAMPDITLKFKPHVKQL